ncbi:MAG TPA: hypothetical protein VK255_01305 [Patescibacteria group bacterium]|nr:hypothetical protein [Patescibacteria group bacterium]
MIIGLIILLYFMIILFYVSTYFFIVYHMVRYSLKPSLNSIILPVFIVGSALLLITNIMLFFAVDWKALLYNFPIK